MQHQGTFSNSLGVFINVYTRSLLSENFALSRSRRYPLVNSVVKKLIIDIPKTNINVYCVKLRYQIPMQCNNAVLL